MRTGTANLPLHTGAAPRWLFTRMVRLAREIALIMVDEYGTPGLLARLADPHWFQAFGCVLGFDWHSSGLTTTTCGALKVGLSEVGDEVGLYAAGGKGNTSRQTPQEITDHAERIGFTPDALIYASKMAAKVDNTAVQDGYQLYHHVMFFDRVGRWAVVQQGMNEANHYARRYHWLGETVADFCDEPHAAVCCDARQLCLNLVAHESDASRLAVAEVARLQPERIIQEVNRLPSLDLPARHEVQLRDMALPRLQRVLMTTYAQQPAGFEQLLSIQGVGPATVRALALLGELMYGAEPSYRDPARFSFAHGGKDGIPYPVDRTTYEQSIHALHGAVERAKVGERDRLEALRRLAAWQEESVSAPEEPFGSAA